VDLVGGGGDVSHGTKPLAENQQPRAVARTR
jgi:hypothetical protein